MSLRCQQCKQPLQLDASLVDLSASEFDVIAASLPHQQHLAARHTSSAVGSPRTRAPRHPGESFVLVQDSIYSQPPQFHQHSSDGRLTTNAATVTAAEHGGPDSPSRLMPLSHHLKLTTRLFQLLSSKTDVDHPLCAECTHILISTLNRELEETRKERDGYIAFEKEVKREKERQQNTTLPDLEKLKLEEQEAVSELQAAEREREELEAELSALEEEETRLSAEEAEFWRVHNEQLITVSQQKSKLAALKASYAADSAVLERLERANVYNDAFCIGHDGVFGTINGLRFGRAAGVNVEWAEINAAWGQTLLLLYTIARKLDFTFENYRLVVMGSFSRVEKIGAGDKASYELYGSGDLHLGRLLHNWRFDTAMVAFLDCLRQLMEYAKSQDPNVDFPHAIVKDKIGEASIKLQFNQDDGWTRALRYVLLALKILLKWTTNG